MSNSGSISRETNSFLDRREMIIIPSDPDRMEEKQGRGSEMSFGNSTIPKTSNVNSALQNKQESKRPVANSESDRDAIISKQSSDLAEMVTNKIHPTSGFVTHGDWRRVVAGDIILYYDPITNVISSTLPDGYPMECQEFLFDEFIHSNHSQYLNQIVCQVNRLFTRVREMLDYRREMGKGADESSHSVSSAVKWHESDSLSQPSGISNRSESLTSHSLLPRNRGYHEDDSETGSVDRTDIKENTMMFLSDLAQNSHGSVSKRRIDKLSEVFDRISSSSSLMSRRVVSSDSGNGGNESQYATLNELKTLLYEGIFY